MKTRFIMLFLLAALFFLSIGCIGEKTSYVEKAGPGYNRYYDTMGGFSIEYPESWNYDDTISIISEGYNVVFSDPQTGARMGIFSEPLNDRDFDELARKELAPPEEMSAVFNPGSFGNFRAYENFYEYEMDGVSYYGEGVIFTDNSSVFGISQTCKVDDRPTLASTFEYMRNSFRVETPSDQLND
jgi:hypothetical protein